MRKFIRKWLGIPDAIPSFLSYPQAVDVVLERKRQRAREPIYATDGSACADFFPVLSDVSTGDGTAHMVELEPGEMMAVNLGWGVQVPKFWCLELHSRSGQGRVRVSLANRTGIIDSDYTGELVALVVNEGSLPYEISENKAICQGKLSPAPQMRWRLGVLASTTRGDGGFGHTDAKKS